MTRVKFLSKAAFQIDTKFTLEEYIFGLEIPAGSSFIFRGCGVQTIARRSLKLFLPCVGRSVRLWYGLG